jgi:hypothetical protein
MILKEEYGEEVGLEDTEERVRQAGRLQHRDEFL